MNKKITFRILMLVVILVSMYFLNVQGEEGKISLDEFKNDTSEARFVIEAENYSSRTSTATGSWWEVDGQTNKFIEGPNVGEVAPTAKSGAHDNYMEFLGSQESSRNIPISESYNGPIMDYKVSIEKAGRYRLYLRWTGRDGKTDSLYAFILKPDGTLLKSDSPDYPDYFFYHYRTEWTWDNLGLKNATQLINMSDLRNASAVWMIPQPGFYTIRLAAREKETAVDALVFQTDNLPAPTE